MDAIQRLRDLIAACGIDQAYGQRGLAAVRKVAYTFPRDEFRKVWNECTLMMNKISSPDKLDVFLRSRISAFSRSVDPEYDAAIHVMCAEFEYNATFNPLRDAATSCLTKLEKEQSQRLRDLITAPDCVTTETGPEKQAPAVRRPITPHEFEQLTRSAEFFFSVVPRDIISIAVRFMRWRIRGNVRDPKTLRFDSVVLCDSAIQDVHMLHYNAADRLMAAFHTLNGVHVYDKHWEIQQTICGCAEDAGVSACVTDSSGRTFVANDNAAGITVVGTAGAVVRSIGTGQISAIGGMDLSADGSVLYVSAYHSHVVEVYSTDTGEHLGTLGEPYVRFPCGVAALSNGHLAVASRDTSEVHIFTGDGAHVRCIGRGAIKRPLHIAVDQDDRLYVTDLVTCFVTVFAADSGRAIHRFGGKGTADGKFERPAGIAIDSNGTLAVADDTRVQLFKCA
jgi:sugar lactone lactonase YvrE